MPGLPRLARYKSQDCGDTWTEVESLTSHPTHSLWQPGFGGLCLHSMALDPTNADRMWVAISSVGVFGTEDGCASWSTMNAGVRADFLKWEATGAVALVGQPAVGAPVRHR